MRQFPKAKGCFYDVKAAVRGEGQPTATDIWIYDVIGDDWYDPSLTAKELCQKIAAIDTAEIVLHFSSPGGSVMDGIAIYNALMTHPAKVTSLIEGWTGSVATVVALAGDTVQMFDNTMWMIHNSWGLQVGNASAMREYAAFLDQVDAVMSKVYLKRITKTDAELQAALDAEMYLTAAEALDWGFVDEVVTGKTLAAAALDTSILEAMGYTLPPGVVRTLPTENEGKLRDAQTLIDEVLSTLAGKAPPAPAASSGDGFRIMDMAGLASLLTAAKRH